MDLANNMNYQRIFTYIGVAAIILLLVGLLGWYFFIQKATQSVQGADQARGFSIGIPSFLGGQGSNAANTNTGGSSGASLATQQETGSKGTQSALLKFLGIGAQPPLQGARVPTSPQMAPAQEPLQKRAPRLFHANLSPVAGAAFVGSGSSTRLRYVERATGNVFDVSPESGDIVRITNTLIPKVYAASMGSGGIVVERTLEDGAPTALVGKIGTSTDGLAALNTKNLGSNVREIASIPTSNNIVTLTRTNAGTRLVRSAWNGASPHDIASTAAGDFRILWPSDNRIFLVEKAGSGVLGSAFNVEGGTLTALIRNIPGLTVLPHPSSDALLYGTDDGTSLSLFARPAGASAIELPIHTTADKCVWGAGTTAYCAVPDTKTGSVFLDRWYRGEVHTEDTWYTVDTGAADATKLFTLSTSDAVDVESPTIDAGGKYLAFLNARDKSLWIFRISDQ